MFHSYCWTTAGAAYAARHCSRHYYKFRYFSRERLLRNDKIILCLYVLLQVTGCVSPFAYPAMQLIALQMETLSGGAIPYATVDRRGERRHALACLRTAARKKPAGWRQRWWRTSAHRGSSTL